MSPAELKKIVKSLFSSAGAAAPAAGAAAAGAAARCADPAQYVSPQARQQRASRDPEGGASAAAVADSGDQCKSHGSGAGAGQRPGDAASSLPQQQPPRDAA